MLFIRFILDLVDVLMQHYFGRQIKLFLAPKKSILRQNDVWQGVFGV